MEVAALKLRYENHVTAISGELKDVQSQVVKLKHERDTYKHLLKESPQQLDLKSSDGSNTTSSLNDVPTFLMLKLKYPAYLFNDQTPILKLFCTDSFQIGELRSQVSSLKQQVNCMEDELSDARIENSRLKTELMSERSAWDVQHSEMTSKINHVLQFIHILVSSPPVMPHICFYYCLLFIVVGRGTIIAFRPY